MCGIFCLREKIDLAAELPSDEFAIFITREVEIESMAIPDTESKTMLSEQMEFVDIYTRQISRWRNEKPSAAQSRELDRMDEQNQQLRGVTAEILALARELRKGTIERVLGMSDLELGLQYLLGRQSSDRR
jgi:hypothetical protein